MLFNLVLVKRVTNMERHNIEQWYAIKFRIKLGDSAKNMNGKLVQVFGNEALSHAQVFLYERAFEIEVRVHWEQFS